MKEFVIFIFISLISFTLNAESLNEYIRRAEQLRMDGKTNEAVNILEEAVREFPDSSSAYAYLGLHLGIIAGEAEDMMKASDYVNRAFTMLDEAVGMDSTNIAARLNRGILYIQVPEFFGRLKTGIKDLEYIAKTDREYPEKVTEDALKNSLYYLAIGYEKDKRIKHAVETLERVIDINPESQMADNAEKKLQTLKGKKKIQPEGKGTAVEKKEDESANLEGYLKLGKKYYENQEYERARDILLEAKELDSTNAEIYLWLGLSVAGMSGEGYSEKIRENTELRINTVFESMDYLDRAVKLKPEDGYLRYVRGMMGVHFPFFVGKLEQSIRDLEIVLESNLSDSTKANAGFLLGYAYQRKGNSQWLKTLSQYPESNAGDIILQNMKPNIEYFNESEHDRPFLLVEFTLGFRDELAPQTAVWIEDEKGKFVRTIYVSGFAGNVKGKQITLPEWAKSDFRDADVITSASINTGHHIFVLESTDIKKYLPEGRYTVNIEVSYWPSMKYEKKSTSIKIGKSEEIAEEKGKIIPYMKVKYYPAEM